MKMFLKLFLLMILPVYMQAQPTVNTDSLKLLLNNEKQDTVQVKLLLQLCQAFFYSKPDTVLVLGQQALDLSRQAGFAMGEVQSIGSLASAFMTIGNNPKALALSLQALEKAEVIGDKIYITRTLGSIGNIYTSQGEYQKALNYHFKALDLCEKIDFNEGVLFSILSIGDIYERTGQLDSAIFYTERGY